MTFFHSLTSILSIIIMVSVGYILTARGWFDENTGKLFARIVSCIALPTYMLSTLLGSFNRDTLIQLSQGLLIPFLSIIMCFILAYFTAWALKIEKGHQGTFRAMFFSSNTIFIGLPINLALFGPDSLPAVLLYYISNTIFFWTLGVYGISSDNIAIRKKIFSRETFEQIFSPPLLALIVAVALILLKISLPIYVMDTFKYLGGMTTPLSMLFIGIMLHRLEIDEIKPNKDMFAIVAGRFIISPLTVLLLALFIPTPPLMKKVFVVQAAMPVMTQISIIAQYYSADAKYAALMTAVTTILVVIVIPIYMTIL